MLISTIVGVILFVICSVINEVVIERMNLYNHTCFFAKVGVYATGFLILIGTICLETARTCS